MFMQSDISECDHQKLCRRRVDRRKAKIALVHELSEPLTAIENYLEAAICLNDAESQAARTKLREVCAKSQIEIVRVNDILRRMRSALCEER